MEMVTVGLRTKKAEDEARVGFGAIWPKAGHECAERIRVAILNSKCPGLANKVLAAIRHADDDVVCYEPLHVAHP